MMRDQLGGHDLVESWYCTRDQMIGFEGGRMLAMHPYAVAHLRAAHASMDHRRPDVDVWLEGVESATVKRAHALLDARIARMVADIVDCGDRIEVDARWRQHSVWIARIYDVPWLR